MAYFTSWKDKSLTALNSTLGGAFVHGIAQNPFDKSVEVLVMFPPSHGVGVTCKISNWDWSSAIEAGADLTVFSIWNAVASSRVGGSSIPVEAWVDSQPLHVLMVGGPRNGELIQRNRMDHSGFLWHDLIEGDGDGDLISKIALSAYPLGGSFKSLNTNVYVPAVLFFSTGFHNRRFQVLRHSSVPEGVLDDMLKMMWAEFPETYASIKYDCISDI